MDGYLFKDGASYHPGEVTVNLEFIAGASGAVPARTANGSRFAGIASVVLTATGIYTVTFLQSFVSLLDYSVNILQATYDVTHAGSVVVKPAEVLVSANPATVALRCYTNNGVATAAALTSGDVLKARFVFARLNGNG